MTSKGLEEIPTYIYIYIHTHKEKNGSYKLGARPNPANNQKKQNKKQEKTKKFLSESTTKSIHHKQSEAKPATNENQQ
jgi:hypothetical protein